MIEFEQKIQIVNILGSLILIVGFPAIGAIIFESRGWSPGFGVLVAWTATVCLVLSAAGASIWPPSLGLLIPVGCGIYPAIGAEILASKHRSGAVGVLITMFAWIPALLGIIFVLSAGVSIAFTGDPEFRFSEVTSAMIGWIIIVGPGVISILICTLIPVRLPRGAHNDYMR